nr:putative metalloprotease [Candidatus Pantoea persica]
MIHLPRGKGGVILLIIVAVSGYYGYDLMELLTGGDVAPTSQQQRVSANDDEAAKFTRVILASTEDTWGKLFQQMGKEYVPPTLVMYRGATQTRCGTGAVLLPGGPARLYRPLFTMTK